MGGQPCKFTAPSSLHTSPSPPTLFDFHPLLPPAAIKVVAGKLLVYPNEFAYPLMPNFGLPPPPSGMLHVKVGAEGALGPLR